MSSKISSGATSSPTSVVEVSELTRNFGPRRAVAGVSFSLLPGECLALFGPNGAGKTTLLRVLAGLLKPTSGNATVSGIQLPGGAPARAQVGLISHHTMLYEALSPRENVAFAARLYGVHDSIARAMVHSRRLVLADEPYSGLDDSGARALTALLEELRAAGTAIVIVTHNLVEGLSLATRAAVMKAGKFVRTDAAEGIDRGSYAATYREALAAGG